MDLIYPITNFRGLGNPFAFSGDPTRVRTMRNIRSQFGRLIARNGYETFGTARDDAIIGFHDYKAAGGGTTLIAIARDDANNSELNYWSGSAWTSNFDFVTTAEDAATDFVDFVNHNNRLHFITPNAADVNYWAGAGTGTALTTPPGRYLASFSGYLLIGASTGGLNDATLQTVRYDDADNGSTWPAGNVLNLRETPGEIKRMMPLGRSLWCYTTVGATILTFVGSALTIFKAERAPTAVGLLASGSLVDIPAVGHLFLGSDGRLYINDGQLVQPVLTELNNTLADNISLSYAVNSRAALNPSQSIYTLCYPASGSSVLDRRLEFNYQTGEFSIFEYSSGFDRIYYSNASAFSGTTLIGSLGTQAYQLDNVLRDNGSVIQHEWQSDWIDMGIPINKTLSKIDLLFDAGADGDIEVAVAQNLNDTFYQPKGLQVRSHNNTREGMETYGLSPALFGQYFNVRVRLFPRTLGSSMVLKGMFLHYRPDPAELKGMGQLQR